MWKWQCFYWYVMANGNSINMWLQTNILNSCSVKSLFVCCFVVLVFLCFFFFSVIRKFAVKILPEMKIIYSPVQFNWRWSLLHCLNLYEVFALLYLHCCTEDPSSQVRSSFSTDVAPRQKKKIWELVCLWILLFYILSAVLCLYLEG